MLALYVEAVAALYGVADGAESVAAVNVVDCALQGSYLAAVAGIEEVALYGIGGYYIPENYTCFLVGEVAVAVVGT